MGLPTSASVEDLRVLISDKLEDGGREQLNVELVLQKTHLQKTILSLRYVEGAFLEANPFDLKELGERQRYEGDVGDGASDEETNVKTLKEVLHVMSGEKSALESAKVQL